MDWKPETFTKNTQAIFGLVKDGSTIARDLIFLILFVLLLRWPTTLSNLLSSAGVTEVNAGIFVWKQQLQASADQNKAAAQANSAATDSLGDVQTALTAIAAQSKDPSIKAQATQALGQVNGSLSSLQNVDQSLTKSLVTQQTILQTPTTSAQANAPAANIVSPQGWVYLGKVDEARQNWVTPPQPKVSSSTPVPQVGQTITLTDDLYLRADKGSSQTYNQAAITGAVRSGSAAKVLDLQPSRARGGGYFLWAKISVNP
jgi:hypothetical protein